jgi:uncharacterized protein with PIN domain
VRFLADMGVDQRVVEWLRAAGHDALHLRDEGLHRLPDPQIFNKAIAEQRIVLTFDLDYRRLVKRRGDKKAIVAVAHSILVIAYHVLRDGQSYRELGSDYFDHLNAERLTRYPHQAARGTRLRRHPHEGA